jgi:signal peptidase
VGGEEPVTTAGATSLPRSLHGVRPALGVAGAVLLGFAAVIVAAITLPALAGYQVLTVLSGSMEPALETGDVIVESKVSPDELKLGDVVTFREPGGPRLITHRVREVRIFGGAAHVTTRGDANTGVERWSIPLDGTVGRVEYRVPKVGYVTNRVGSRFGRLALLVVPALLLCLWELKRIWAPAKAKDDDA